MSSDNGDSDARPGSPTSVASVSLNPESVEDTSPTMESLSERSDDASRETDASIPDDISNSSFYSELTSKIKTLAATVIWPDSLEETIGLSLVPNSTKWLVVMLTRGEDTFVLRTPLPGRARNVHDPVAKATFIDDKVGLPLPELISIDSTDANPLERPYVLQKKVLGSTLQDVYPSLPYEAKCQIAIEIGTWMRKVFEVSCSVDGCLLWGEDDDSELSVVKSVAVTGSIGKSRFIPPSDKKFPTRLLSRLEDAPPELTTYESMVEMLENHMEDLKEELDNESNHDSEHEQDDADEEQSGDSANEEAGNSGQEVDVATDNETDGNSNQEETVDADDEEEGNSDGEEDDSASDEEQSDLGERELRRWAGDLYDKFVDITMELEAAGRLESDRFALMGSWHLFHPHNIIIHHPASPDEPMIKAFLDTDSFYFSPKFSCCEPPMWLWTPTEPAFEDAYGRLDERLANRTMENEERRDIKALFDEAVGPEFVRLSYPEEYRIARYLYRTAILGLHRRGDWSQGKCERAQDIVDEAELLDLPMEDSL